MSDIKSKIIPNGMKSNIDEILEKQLFNVNRYYAESNPNISQLMDLELSNTPEEYLKKLIERWNWHNYYYEELLEPAYLNLFRENQSEMSISELADLIKIYSTSCLIDEATLVMSGSIKKYLDYWFVNIDISDENISRFDAKNMLITPPVETFFAQYRIDHLFYIYLMKIDDNKAFQFKKILMEKYHANDETIFDSRFKLFLDKSNLTTDELLAEINGYRIPDSYKVNHFYFTMEHSNRKAFRDIIIYDNLYEKLIACKLIGISGFLLRKKILEYLNDSKILPNSGYIYEFSNFEVIESLNKLIEERRTKMDKDVKPYRQNGDTCAIVCMLMVLEYYGLISKVTWYDEKRFYKIYGSRIMPGTPFSALTYHFSKKNLNTTIFHSETTIFDNSKKILPDYDFQLAMNEYCDFLNKSKELGTNVVNGIKIDSNLLRSQLEDGNLVILAGEMMCGYHAILITGFSGDDFIVCDPLYNKKKFMAVSEIDKFMDTSIGKWFISVNDKTKEKEKLMDNLNEFANRADELMCQTKGSALKHGKK